jgi:hypothetical protein
MLYLIKGQPNTLVLNINNNSRDVFTTYTLEFTHVMSKEVKTYSIDVNDPLQYDQNIRYCNIYLNLNINDLNYEGQYQLNIYGEPTTKLVYVGMAMLEGTAESHPFTQYISNNEVNENFIYIQE